MLWGQAPSWAVSQGSWQGTQGKANCKLYYTDGLGLFSAGVACHELLLLGSDQLLQHSLHDGHHHGGGRGVGQPHGQHGGAAHEAEQQPARQGDHGDTGRRPTSRCPVGTLGSPTHLMVLS